MLAESNIPLIVIQLYKLGSTFTIGLFVVLQYYVKKMGRLVANLIFFVSCRKQKMNRLKIVVLTSKLDLTNKF